MSVTLTHFAGRAGDHNDRAMHASPLLAAILGQRFRTLATVIGVPEASHPLNWDSDLAAALPSLRRMAAHYDALFLAGRTPVTALGRCAVALATLPIVASHRPDAVVVWFDAHADLNTPLNTPTGYLGGLALAGPLGLWESGLGAGLTPGNTVLVGARDLDAGERTLIDAGHIDLVTIGSGMAEHLRRVIAGRPVYVHIDCDVLEPGLVPTDYSVSHGMSFAQLEACAQALAQCEVVGLEIAELEVDTPERDAAAFLPAHSIVRALEPLLQTLGE
jgi:arginase